MFKEGKVKREDVVVVTKLWNTNHRPERVKPAFEGSLKKLQLEFIDLYLIHTPFAFQPGDEQDPRDIDGTVIYDKAVTLPDTWMALEALVDEGKCKAIGLSDVSLEQAIGIFDAARIKPAVVHVESYPYLPEWDLLNYCKQNGIVLQAFAVLGHSSEPRLLDDPVITAIARRVNKIPAQVLLAWAIQRGTALLTTSKTPGRIKENFEVSAIPEDALRRSPTESSPGSGSMPLWRPAFPGSFREARSAEKQSFQQANRSMDIPLENAILVSERPR